MHKLIPVQSTFLKEYFSCETCPPWGCHWVLIMAQEVFHVTYYLCLSIQGTTSLEQSHYLCNTEGYFQHTSWMCRWKFFSVLWPWRPLQSIACSMYAGMGSSTHNPETGLLGTENKLMDGYHVLIPHLERSSDLPSHLMQSHSFIHSFSLCAYSYSRSQGISKQVVGGKQRNTLGFLPLCGINKEKNI